MITSSVRKTGDFGSRDALQPISSCGAGNRKKTITIKIRNGGKPARIKGKVGSSGFNIKAEAGEYFEIVHVPGRPVKAYNLAGNASYCYAVEVSVFKRLYPKVHGAWEYGIIASSDVMSFLKLTLDNLSKLRDMMQAYSETINGVCY